MFLHHIREREIEPPQRAFAWVGLIVAAVAIVFWSTSASLVAAWNSSGTYSHGFFIVPAFFWLVWGRRRELARLPVQPTWWAYPLLVAMGMLWLFGQWMALVQPSQFAMVAMVPLTMACALGIVWVRALLFPLVFLFFAVPVGESLVPVMMDWTADFTVAALRASGVPVYRDGLHFEIPSGRWSVVDSCSGIRYLFACLAVSSLFSWTIYRSTARRLTFVGLALAVAVVANWFRAYAIVMLGHLSNNQIAIGVDHLVYGGLFFGIIMALVFALGALWREDAPEAAQPRAPTETVHASETPRPAAVLATLAALLVWPALSIGSARNTEQIAMAAPDLRPRGGWVSLEQPLTTWQPVLRNPASMSSLAFAKDDKVVGMHIGLFGPSTPDAKLTSALNRFLQPDGLDPHWMLSKQGAAHTRWRDDAIDVKTGVLVGGGGAQRLLAWQWYWVDGAVTADPLRASALQVLARLRGGRDVSAWITVYTVGDEGVAARTLGSFLGEMADSIDAALGAPDALAARSASND